MTNEIFNDLRSEMERILISFVENPAKDFPSYLERVGLWKGLNQAVQIVTQTQEDETN